MIGMLILARAKLIGYGWLFPIGCFFLLSGFVDLMHVFSSSGIVSHGVRENPYVFKMMQRLLADWLLSVGFWVSYIRVRNRIYTNHFMTWGLLLVASAIVVSFIIWLLGSTVIQVSLNLEDAGPWPFLTYYAVLALTWMFIGHLFRDTLIFTNLSIMTFIAMIVTGFSTAVADTYMVVGNVIQLLAYLWLYWFVAQPVHDNRHDKFQVH